MNIHKIISTIHIFFSIGMIVFGLLLLFNHIEMNTTLATGIMFYGILSLILALKKVITKELK